MGWHPLYSGLLVIRAISVATREACSRGVVDYSQNIRTFEELYDNGYIKADTYSITKSMLGGELLGSFLLRVVLTLCLYLAVKCRLYVIVALS